MIETQHETLQFLTADQVARLLNVKRSWVYSHVQDLPTRRFGRLLRFHRDDIQAYLETTYST
jgi:excisionase family DNA binding protein